MRRMLLILLVVVPVIAAGVFLPGIGWSGLARHQEALRTAVSSHPIAAACLFVLAYCATAALSLPYGALLTVTGGLLFGAVRGCALTVIGATSGATLLLIILRSALAKTAARYRDRIPEAVRLRLARDGFLYLLAIRLVPLFPFWTVNLAAALAGIRPVVFVCATLIGILPVTYVLSTIGARLGSLLAAGQAPDLSVLFAPRILLPLLGLAALSLLPALVRRRPGQNA